MSSFIQKALLQTRSSIFTFKRFRGKINIQKPRLPHYERARVIAVTTPIYPERPVNENCFTESPYKEKQKIHNPYNDIIAKEVLNWLNHSQMVGIFHMNSISSDDIFKVRVALHKQNMHLKSYGKKIIKLAVENTKYENILQLFDSNHCIVFSSENKVPQLLKITKKVPQLILIAGIADNTLMSRNEFTNYGKLPNLQAVRAQFVSTLNSAGGQVVNNLESHQKQLVHLLDIHSKSGNNEDDPKQKGDEIV